MSCTVYNTGAFCWVDAIIALIAIGIVLLILYLYEKKTKVIEDGNKL